MDGTLTVAVHDFNAIRVALGLPAGAAILEQLAALPAAQAAPLSRRLEAWERGLAERAIAGPGVGPLLETLRARGVRLGVLTRNTRDLALLTLERAGLLHYFADEDVLGRGEAAPKPEPDGVVALARRWALRPAEVVMVGDYLFDLQAGRRAGARTALLDAERSGRWPEWADQRVTRLDHLLGVSW